MKFRQYHLCSVLKSFESTSAPLDALLSRYFRAHKAIGSKDRAFISETAYNFVRYKNLYEYCKKGPEETVPIDDLSLPAHLRYGMPKELYEALLESYGEEKASEICQLSNTRAPLTVRVNTLKTTRQELLTRWEGKYAVSPCRHAPDGIVFKERINFFTLAEFKEGLFEIQDESSQLAALLVDVTPQDLVLDFCAGAGGKTLAFAPRMKNKGQIYLHDIRPLALKKGRTRLLRAGIQNVQFRLPPKGKMDVVVVDVPCSGTGTLRRNPDLKWKFNLETLNRLAQEQRKIFQEALTYLRPGGTIVYMTCSLLPQENELQTDFFGLKIKRLFQTPPILNGQDGFYAVSLQS
jgi:16S rRNA C967 or C1407 C5-methylase (RsmB/RsmF family)